MDDQNLLENLKRDIKYLDIVYTKHKTYCLNFMKKYHSDSDVIKDIYQDAVIVFYEKALSKSFILSSSIQTYLNSICYNQVITRFKKDSKNTQISEEINPNTKDWFDKDEHEDNEKQFTSLEKALAKLKEAGGNCYEILQRFFFLKQSNIEIAKEMDYSNADNVKNQKARCQKRLKELTFSYFKAENSHA
jgi:RNA polymerase sigma factor (sigma-70 family)